MDRKQKGENARKSAANMDENMMVGDTSAANEIKRRSDVTTVL